MRVMVLVKANKDSEAGLLPDQKILAEMGKFNEELVKAGVMLEGEGLHPSSKGARVRFSGRQRTVIDGPFTEAKELIAGYWLWQVKSMDEAIEWVKRSPFQDGEVEIRQVSRRRTSAPRSRPNSGSRRRACGRNPRSSRRGPDDFRYPSGNRRSLADRIAQAHRRTRADRAGRRSSRGSRAGRARRCARTVARVRRPG